MSTVSVGVDMAKLKFDVAMTYDGKYKHRVFDNTPTGHALFLEWLATWPGAPVCLEATGTYGEALATYLFDHDVRVSAVNPARIKAFANPELSRSKTDQGNAKRIARFALLHQPEAWQPTPKHLRALQAWVRRLDDLLALQSMEHNRRLTADATVQASIQTLLDTLSSEITATRQAIAQHIDTDPTHRDGAFFRRAQYPRHHRHGDEQQRGDQAGRAGRSRPRHRFGAHRGAGDGSATPRDAGCGAHADHP